MKVILITLMMLSYSAYAKDGALLDSNGLTVKLNSKPVVDDRRWNFDKGTYTNKENKKVTVQTYVDSNDKVVGLYKEGFGADQDGVYTNNLIMIKTMTKGNKFSDGNPGSEGNNNILITSNLCEKFKKRDILKKSQDCKKSEKEITDLYLEEFADDNNVTALAGALGQPQEGIKKAFADLAFRLKNRANKMKTEQSFIDEDLVAQTYVKCDELKHFSEPVETPVVKTQKAPEVLSK